MWGWGALYVVGVLGRVGRGEPRLSIERHPRRLTTCSRKGAKPQRERTGIRSRLFYGAYLGAFAALREPRRRCRLAVHSALRTEFTRLGGRSALDVARFPLTTAPRRRNLPQAGRSGGMRPGNPTWYPSPGPTRRPSPPTTASAARPKGGNR